MKQSHTLDQIALHAADERQRVERKDYYGVRESIQDRLDLQQGIIFSRYLRSNFNKQFDIKHNYNLGFPSKNLEKLPEDEYNGLKIYTMSRWLSYKRLLK